MASHEDIRRILAEDCSKEEVDTEAQLNNSIRFLGKWRSAVIQNILIRREGTQVLSGPFKGMKFLESSMEGCHIPKLLGCYEQPLFLHIEKLINSEFEVIVNIGCAEGYYAVGLALRMQRAKILAFDSNIKAQVACRKLAQLNDVSERIQIEGTCGPNEFNKIDPKKALILCDIEGAEKELLNPEKIEILKKFTMVIESHECLEAGVTELLINRFHPTHDIIRVNDNGARNPSDLPNWFYELPHLDQLIATWEWRSGPTPWLIIAPKASS